MTRKFLAAFACLAVLHAGLPGALAAGVGRVVPGDTPPPSLGTNLDGDEVDTARFAGKVLVVTFWASWCAPCRRELPMLEAMQRVAGAEKMQVVAINIEDRDTYRRLARRLGPSFSLSVNHDTGKKSSEAYGVHGIPHMVLIGRDGKVIAVHRGYSEQALDGILAEINRALAAGPA